MNPYAILAAVLVWLGSVAGGMYLGWDYRGGKVAQEKVEAVNDALQKAGQQAKSDMEAATKRAAENARANERARAAKSEGIRDAVTSARGDCVRSAESMRLLNLAIDAINSPADSSGGLSLKMSGTTETKGRAGFNPAPF